jgi:GntR family transcriptional regulator
VLDLQVTPGDARPIYRQIIDQVVAAVGRGQARAGDPVPSVRALADRLVVNPNTVARAYAELVRDGLFEARQGKGYVIAERRRVYADGERRRRLDAAIEAVVNEATVLGIPADELRVALERRLKRLAEQ